MMPRNCSDTKNVTSGFRATEQRPFNPKVFSENDFGPRIPTVLLQQSAPPEDNLQKALHPLNALQNISLNLYSSTALSNKENNKIVFKKKRESQLF